MPTEADYPWARQLPNGEWVECKSMREVIDNQGRIARFRWRLFGALSHLLYWVCPEPHRTALKGVWQLKSNEITKLSNELREMHHAD